MWSFLEKGMKVYYYAVARGKKIGVFNSWEECKKSVEKFPNARHKKFLSEKDAIEFIRTNSGNAHFAGITRTSTVGNNWHVQNTRQMSSSHQPQTGQTSTATTASSSTSSASTTPSNGGCYRTPDGTPIVYTDGACSSNGNRGAKAGIGVFWGDDHPDNVSAPIEGKATNNRAEYLAIITAIERAIQRDYTQLVIRTDCQLIIKSMCLWLKGWKKNGWKTKTGTAVANRDLLERLDQLMGRIGVRFEKVNGHSDDYGNDRADLLAVEGARQY